MSETARAPSPRRDELLEAAYQYVLEHGVGALSLRPLASAIQSSPRVVLFLFGSKAELVKALLARAREDELELLSRVREASASAELTDVVRELWRWLAAEEHRALLMLWVEGYARSLIESRGPWAGFALATVDDWLKLLADAQPTRHRNSMAGQVERTLVLAVLRGALLDLLATRDLERTTAAINEQLTLLRRSAKPSVPSARAARSRGRTARRR